MRILLWHVHGGWTDGFVRGDHDYLLPVDANGNGGRGTRPWPANVRDIPHDDLREMDIDVIVLQRIEELAEAERLLGRVPGRDVPAVFVEHNTPKEGAVPNSVHPLAERSDIPIAHVTHFNRLFWDCGRAPTLVIEHGVPDPGPRFTGEIEASGVVINEPIRRSRVSGSDLLPGFAELAPVDVFGIGTDGLAQSLGVSPVWIRSMGDLQTDQLHTQLARRRLYLHSTRWTSLGLSLLEAMHLAMPVIALGTTEVWRAVPPEAGLVSCDLAELHAFAANLLSNPEEARERGLAAREFVLEHYGLAKFLSRWDEVLTNVVNRVATTA